ncbi:hypothetical protein [Nocardia alni]|uniref:hypothetical protein n=1 Tax=Nocardia alni TaxID=2815723 RepID=UPI0020B35DFB|nr:hypothetical protein [Nocardia alni]
MLTNAGGTEVRAGRARTASVRAETAHVLLGLARDAAVSVIAFVPSLPACSILAEVRADDVPSEKARGGGDTGRAPVAAAHH